MSNFFTNENHHVFLRPLTTIANTGFRPGQLGALHSVVAHFSVHDDPAIICLPTGYGKTAVIMALPFLLGAQRVLIVEPSDALRRQTSGHFKTLSTLRKLHVVPDGMPDPAVHGQKGCPASPEEWQKLAVLDVVVSTPQSTSPALAPGAPQDLFDLIIFDEAHHAPADTWSAYLDHFGGGTRYVFLTATPFRRDKKAIPGKLAYWYPVSKASREKAFGKVRFAPARVVNDLNEEEIDRSVAHTAAQQLVADRAAGFDHRLFVRAASIKSARTLIPLYADEGLKVEAIDSYVSKRKQDEYEAKLLNGELDGVICVDMFGEGYDFPKLKVAALHAPHRSLVPTLQFIGRFARTNDDSTGDATLVAPVGRLREATLKLFQEGVDIGELIDAAAREQLAESEADRQILDVLKTKRQAESDYDAVSPLSLELYAHTRIFECAEPPDFTCFGSTIARHLKLAKQWMSDDGLMALLLTVDHAPPNFATAEVLVNVRHDAFVFRYIPKTKLCYIGSTRRTERLYLDLMQTVCKDHHRPLSYEMTRRAIAGLENLRFYNVGLKNTAINTQAESYRVLTGPQAERAVTAGDGRAFVQGHFFGSGIVDNERETVGASSSSRIWSNRRLSVVGYLDWVALLDVRLSGTEAVAESQLDLVHHSKQLTKLPDMVIAAGWNKAAYRAAPRVRFRHAAWDAWEYAQVTDIDLGGFVSNPAAHELTFNIQTDTLNAPYRFSAAGGPLFSMVGNDWQVEVLSRLDDWTEMETWLSINPPVFYASDKSSFLSGREPDAGAVCHHCCARPERHRHAELGWLCNSD